MNALWKTPLVAVLSAMLIGLPVLGLTGCSSTQTQATVTTVVTDIANWTPVISSDISILATDVAAFDATDAAAIQSFVTTLQTSATNLTTLAKSYLAAPSTTLLTQISSTVNSMATSTSAALLGLAQIKNPTSQATAKGILTTLATAMTILTGYLTVTATTAQLHEFSAERQVKLAETRQYLDRGMLEQALAQAKQQGLAPKWATVDEALDAEQRAGL